MKIFAGLFLVFLIFSCFACQTEPTRQVNISTPTPYPSPPTTPYRPPLTPSYTEPQIGMKFEYFKKLCMNSKERTSEDRWSSFESANGTTYRITRGYTANRAKNRCYGTFSFVEGELDSIYND